MTSALAYRDFRLLWASSLASWSGQWIQQAALGWVVYEITGSGALLGAVLGARAIPMLALTPMSGVAADRWDRRRDGVPEAVFRAIYTEMNARLQLQAETLEGPIEFLGDEEGRRATDRPLGGARACGRAQRRSPRAGEIHRQERAAAALHREEPAARGSGGARAGARRAGRVEFPPRRQRQER